MNNFNTNHESEYLNAQYAYYQIESNSQISTKKELEITISKSPFWATEYAKNILKTPFPLAEPEIAKSIYSLNYAQHILKSRFKLAENNLINRYFFNPLSNIIQYTKCILKFNHE